MAIINQIYIKSKYVLIRHHLRTVNISDLTDLLGTIGATTACYFVYVHATLYRIICVLGVREKRTRERERERALQDLSCAWYGLYDPSTVGFHTFTTTLCHE